MLSLLLLAACSGSDGSTAASEAVAGRPASTVAGDVVATATAPLPADVPPTTTPTEALVETTVGDVTVSAVPVGPLIEPSTVVPGTVGSTTPAVPPSAVPLTITPGAVLQIAGGTTDLGSLVRQMSPLILDTTAAPLPADVTVGIAVAGEGSPLALAGSRVSYEFQMYAWRTGDVYDGTPPGAPASAVVGSGDVPAALDTALRGTSPGTHLVVTYPLGMPGIPDFVPDDDAYYLIVTVLDVTI